MQLRMTGRTHKVKVIQTHHQSRVLTRWNNVVYLQITLVKSLTALLATTATLLV